MTGEAGHVEGMTPDFMRCQAESRTSSPFQIGGLGPYVRCERVPAWLAEEIVPGKDGLMGAMTVCDEHKVKMADCVDIARIKFTQIFPLDFGSGVMSKGLSNAARAAIKKAEALKAQAAQAENGN